jgi:hypothetical protein
MYAAATAMDAALMARAKGVWFSTELFKTTHGLDYSHKKMSFMKFQQILIRVKLGYHLLL